MGTLAYRDLPAYAIRRRSFSTGAPAAPGAVDKGLVGEGLEEGDEAGALAGREGCARQALVEARPECCARRSPTAARGTPEARVGRRPYRPLTPRHPRSCPSGS